MCAVVENIIEFPPPKKNYLDQWTFIVLNIYHELQTLLTQLQIKCVLLWKILYNSPPPKQKSNISN